MPTESDEDRPEFALIDWIRSKSKVREEIEQGIGDDAAILNCNSGQKWVTAVDVITEGVHFTSETAPALIGRKALAINLSDIAAMGATPIAAFVGIVLPQQRDETYARQIYDGIFSLAEQFNISIAGGDTNSWDGGLVVSVTVQGVLNQGEPIYRSGAQPGDHIFVTGPLGGSLGSGRHLKFTPRLIESQKLLEHFRPTAMLDLSDGLGSDLFHLTSSSGVGAIIESAAIPIHDDVPTSVQDDQRLHQAISDGEDFELLFTLTTEQSQELLKRGPSLGLDCYRIGVCTAEKNVLLKLDDQQVQFPQGGWRHTFGS